MAQAMKMEVDSIDGVVQEQDYAQFNILFKETYTRHLASLLTKDYGFFQHFQAFVEALKLGPAGFPIIQEIGGSKPPIYNALSKLVTTWISKTPGGAMFDKLLEALKECGLESGQENLGKWWLKKYPSKGDTPTGKVDPKDAHDIAMTLAFEESLQEDFEQFMNHFELGADDQAAIRHAFSARKMTSPFYDLAKKCLDRWCSKTPSAQRTWKTLLLILKGLNMAEAEVSFTQYFEDNVEDGRSALQ